MADHRFDQLRNICRIELAIAIDVHHDIRALRECNAHRIAKRRAEAQIRPVSDDLGTRLPSLTRRRVSRCIVDDNNLDLADSIDAPRNGRYDGGDSLFLVQARYDDEEMQTISTEIIIGHGCWSSVFACSESKSELLHK